MTNSDSWESGALGTGATLEEISRALLADHLQQPERERVSDDSGRMDKVLVVAGPTGCGKTAFSLTIAEQLDGEIVSADSMQVYRGMDIGTAKATLAQRQRIPHHMIDIRNISESFSVVDYYYEAQSAIDKIRKAGKVPIIVGGAGFYLRTVLYGPPSGPPSVASVRRQLEQEMEAVGTEAMYERLKAEDPGYASTITSHDRRKIIRGLEIVKLTGKPVSLLTWRTRVPALRGQYHCWFLYRPRPSLYRRVEERCMEMLADGLVDEVKRLQQQGLEENGTASAAIGYRQCLDYLKGLVTYDEFVDAFKRASRHYVKRQLTWFRKEPLFRWIDATHDDEVLIDLVLRDFSQ